MSTERSIQSACAIPEKSQVVLSSHFSSSRVSYFTLISRTLDIFLLHHLLFTEYRYVASVSTNTAIRINREFSFETGPRLSRHRTPYSSERLPGLRPSPGLRYHTVQYKPLTSLLLPEAQ
jgi:hypothetical protein